MKIAYCSDLHLEFGDIVLENEGGADVLILAGDILVTEHLRRYQEHSCAHGHVPATKTQRAAHRYQSFIERISREFQDIVIVAGNHEFYHGIWDEDVDFLQEFYGDYGNVHFLEMDHVVLHGITFTGGTLWTDCNRGDALTIGEMTLHMNDYRVINSDQTRGHAITPSVTLEHHYVTVGYLENILQKHLTEKYVVVGHHAPSPLSRKNTSKKRSCINGAYCSDLSGFIKDNQQIACWVHGHIHKPFDYMIGGSRIVCNPRGYVGYQDIAGDFRVRYIDV